jgi:hypothetical protein
MRFNEFNMVGKLLLEGGNSRAIDIDSGDHKSPREWKGRAAFAEKIDLRTFPRKVVTHAFIDAFRVLNEKFKAFSAAEENRQSMTTEKNPQSYSYQEGGEYLWPDFDVIESGMAFNGSSDAFFNPKITDEEYIQHKQKVGDIDLTVPGQHSRTLWALLRTLEGQPLTDKITYIGQNKPSAGSLQINAVFDLTTDAGTVFAQVDFEASEYEHQDGKFYPTEWAKFSHNSHWDDMTNGVKGVFHKFILRAITSTISQLPDTAILTDKSGTWSDEEVADAQAKLNAANAALKDKEYQLTQTTDKETVKTLKGLVKDLKDQIKDIEREIKANSPKISKSSDDEKSMSAFAVQYGIRDKLARQKDSRGNELTVGDPETPGRRLNAYKKIDTKDSTYISSLAGIFEKLFQRQPQGDDLRYLQSFVGILSLIKPITESNPKFAATVRDRFMELLWGVGARDVGQYSSPEDFKPAFGKGQGLERDDWQVDMNVKVSALNKMFQLVPQTKVPQEVVEKILFLYYGDNGSAYGNKAGDADAIQD